MLKVQVFNGELGTKKYVGQLGGYVACNGFVLAVIVDENGCFKCEKLTEIQKISETEKDDGRLNENRNTGGLGTDARKLDNPGTDGRAGSKASTGKGFLRRG